MITNSTEIVHQLREDFIKLTQLILNSEEGKVPDADTVERMIFVKMIEFARTLLSAFFVRQNENLQKPTMLGKEGNPLPYHCLKSSCYYSVFGPIALVRRYYYQKGKGKGEFLLDATLNLPVKGPSDFLREWQNKLSGYGSYHQARKVLADIVGQKFSTRQLSEVLQEETALITAFHQQKEKPVALASDTLLVVQADGKGVPMKQPTEGGTQVRLGKGQKHSRKKEAIVTTLYTVAPTPRSAEAVVASLFEHKKYPEKRPRPQNKGLWATLEGKEIALSLTREHSRLWSGVPPHGKERTFWNGLL